MTEFKSRRELREAERQGLVPKPEQVFDLPTGSIRLPEVSEMLTRKRIREMEREGLLDPLTGSVPVFASGVADSEPGEPAAVQRGYDEVLAETEEPIISSISAVVQSTVATPAPATLAPTSLPPVTAPKPVVSEPVAATDIFHSMALDAKSRKPNLGIVIAVILAVLGGAGASAYMLGIFK